MDDRFFAPRRSAVILDPAIATRNAGDEVISQAVRRWVRHALPNHFITNAPTHESMGIRSYRLIRQSDYAIVGGSNILTSRLLFDRGWRVGFRDMVLVDKLVLLAAGWRDYQKKPDAVTGMILRRLLDPNAVHSVRDTHTKDMLAQVGITNVVVTACVTMWQLTPEHLATIPKTKGRVVVTTLSMRQPSPKDVDMLTALSKLYDEVWVWPQGIDDLGYIDSLPFKNMRILPPTLEGFDEALMSDDSVDYFGVRLHAGIRALQRGRRSYIIAVDNRAKEIGKDTDLPVIARTATIDEISALIEADYSPKIVLPTDAIQKWLGQFRKSA